MTRKLFPYCTNICRMVPGILEKFLFPSVILWTVEISGKLLLNANMKGIYKVYTDYLGLLC